MPEEDTNEACQENEDIGSISFTFNTSDNEHGFPLDRSDLAQTTTNENPMMYMKVIDEDDGDEGSDDASINFTDNEEKNIIDEDDSDEN